MNEFNDDILISIIAGSVLLFILCVFIVAFLALFVKKRAQHKIEKQKLKNEFSKVLLQSQLEIKNQTLKKLVMNYMIT